MRCFDARSQTLGHLARLCRESNAKGNHVADAYLAALVIESGGEWVSTDGDYARFKGLVWTRPF